MPLFPDHPRLLLAPRPTPGLRTVGDLRQAITSGHAATLWRELLAAAEADLERPAFRPDELCPGRAEADRRIGNREYNLIEGTARRLMYGALAGLVLDDRRFVDGMLRQLACLYDETAWPDWRDLAHLGTPADLRTGQLLRAIGYAYDWTCSLLTEDERRFIREGLDRRGFQPYREALAAGAAWAGAVNPNNWQTCIVGGAGIAAMAFHGELADAGELLDFATQRMTAYLDWLGPEGEFNENPAYASAMQYPIDYYATWRYAHAGEPSPLDDPRLLKFARWYLHHTLPDGRCVAFGDGKAGKPVNPSLLVPLAAAARDGLLQHFYLANQASERRHFALELLQFDPTVEPIEPVGELPLAAVYRHHSANWISRSAWRKDAVVACGKGGHGWEGHGHHDAGSLCLEAGCQPLIVDLGTPLYPSDFFGPERWRYYVASARGHNVILIDDWEFTSDPARAAVILDAVTDDAHGLAWYADLSPLYDVAGARVRRAVLHLLPGVVAVLDTVELAGAAPITVRWHTADRAEPGADGTFTVRNGGRLLTACMVSLAGGAPRFSRGEHAYAPPYDTDRRGQPLPQLHESYVQAAVTTDRARLLTLFAVDPRGDWEAAGGSWQIATAEGTARVSVTGDSFSAACATGGLSLPL